MNELLLAGCTQDQSSYDALFDEVSHGAMTYNALQTIRDMNYELTYEQLYDELSYRIEDARYPQTP
jgi:metacaspase-1